MEAEWEAVRSACGVGMRTSAAHICETIGVHGFGVCVRARVCVCLCVFEGECVRVSLCVGYVSWKEQEKMLSNKPFVLSKSSNAGHGLDIPQVSVFHV